MHAYGYILIRTHVRSHTYVYVCVCVCCVLCVVCVCVCVCMKFTSVLLLADGIYSLTYVVTRTYVYQDMNPKSSYHFAVLA
jgi:hypothetical protein